MQVRGLAESGDLTKPVKLTLTGSWPMGGVMPIYDKPVWRLMRDMVDDIGLQKGQVISRDRIVSWFTDRYPRIKGGTISAHLLRMSTNAPSRVHYHGKPGDDDLFFQIDSGHFRLYDPEKDPQPLYEGVTSSLAGSTEPVEDEAAPGEFAYEDDLRNYLAKSLHLIEPGLHLYEEEGITGIEFPAGGRFIDILAIDSQGNFVVIELKVSSGYDRTVGQLLRYMGWIAENLAEPSQSVRGMIVARKVSEDLLLACRGLPNVELFSYELRVSLKRAPGS